jgi:hypothetical protein
MDIFSSRQRCPRIQSMIFYPKRIVPGLKTNLIYGKET